MLPSAERQAACAEYLAEMPGMELLASIEGQSTETWPKDGLYIESFVRPGFNGNTTVIPYRNATYDTQKGMIALEGSGLFCMVYENAQLQSDSAPFDRDMPDFVDLSQPGICDIVPLENGGRLLVDQHTTEARGGGKSMRKDTLSWEGVLRTRHLTTHAELRPHLARLAAGMGLEGSDAETFADQPFQKIERYIQLPAPTESTSEKKSRGGLLGWLRKH